MKSNLKPFDTLSLSASARSALGRKGVTEICDLTLFTESEISSLSGVGHKTLEVLQSELKRHNLDFRKTY